MIKRCNCKPENSTDEPCECGDCAYCRETDSIIPLDERNEKDRSWTSPRNRESRPDIESKDLAKSNKDILQEQVEFIARMVAKAEEEAIRNTLGHVLEIIEEHKNCSKYHTKDIDGVQFMRSTCLTVIKEELTALTDSPQVSNDVSESGAPMTDTGKNNNRASDGNNGMSYVDTRKGLCKCGHEHIKYNKSHYRTYCTEGSKCNCESYEGADA